MNTAINYIRFYKLFGNNINDIRTNHEDFVNITRLTVIVISINLVSFVCITKKKSGINIRIHKNSIIRK